MRILCQPFNSLFLSNKFDLTLKSGRKKRKQSGNPDNYRPTGARESPGQGGKAHCPGFRTPYGYSDSGVPSTRKERWPHPADSQSRTIDH
jgi:hypothetical protein